MSTSASRYVALCDEIETELAPYGGYLAMRGAAAGEQRLGIAELSLLAIGVVLWALKKYLGAYLEELGKKHAAPSDYNKSGELNIELPALRTELKQLLLEVRLGRVETATVRRRLDELAYHLPPFSASPINAVLTPDELIELLIEFGLTNRVAGKLSARLIECIRMRLEG